MSRGGRRRRHRYSADLAPATGTPGTGTPAAGTPTPGTRATRTTVAGALAAGAGVVAALHWARRWRRVVVSGDSMHPALQAGDRVVVFRARSLLPGDIVAARDPRQPDRTVLKRVSAIGPDEVFLLGDNPGQSTDSRQFGPVPLQSVEGKVVYRYAPPARAGRLYGAR